MSARANSDESRWAAVVRRDRAADGHFFYSVRTTGIYCRPSCGARLPNRENVEFHDTLAEAETAGFRPCKRCLPGAAAVEDRHAELAARACRMIDSGKYSSDLGTLAQALGVSPFHLQRLFKKTIGITPKQYAAARRAEQMREGLRGKKASVTATIYDNGYSSSSRFYENSTKILGMTPTRLRSGGEGTAIRFAVGQCSLGAVLVAASEHGVCAVFLGDDPNELVRNLEDRFPRAELIGADREFENVVAQVVGSVEKPEMPLRLPLDIRGTAFQQKVWQALQKIPPGRTATYAEIAASIGLPKAVRAVAGACAANPVAVAIPCHRVVRSDGNLSGYRWGVARKRELLKREQEQSPLFKG